MQFVISTLVGMVLSLVVALTTGYLLYCGEIGISIQSRKQLDPKYYILRYNILI